MELRVQAHQSLAAIEGAIVRHWPDLALPGARWKLIGIHESIGSSIYLEDDYEGFMVEANRDLRGVQVPIMFEYQFWNVAQNRFYGILEPRTHANIGRGIGFMFRDIPGHECHAKPCFSNLNGSPLEAFAEYNIHGGDYIVVSGIDTARETVRLIGYWSAYASLQEIPLTQEFSRNTDLAMQTDVIPMEKCQRKAILLQRNMVKVYHDLQKATNVAALRQGTILAIASADGHDPQEVHPIRMTEVQWGIRRSFEFPLLLEALVISDMLEHSWAGTFVEVHRTVFVLSLPSTLNPLDQVILIRPPKVWVPEVSILAEFRVEGIGQDQELHGESEMIMVFINTPTSWDDLLRRLHLDREYGEYDCLVSLNDRVLYKNEQGVHALDGDVVRVWYSMSQRQNDTAINVLIPQQHGPEHEGQGQQSRVNQSPAQDAPTGEAMPQFLPGTLHHTLLWMVWMGNYLVSMWRTCRLRSRRYRQKNLFATSRTRARMKITGMRKGVWMKPWHCLVGLACCAAAFASEGSIRFGEALHPGPSLWIGTANPSRVTGKERQLAELPSGIWGITETHLSGVNQKASIRRIQHEARVHGRELHCVPGAPLPIRARSSTVGTWAGVITLSDCISRSVTCQWPNGEFNLGRAQVVHSCYGPFSVMGATVYGWPKSPTWPNALRDTNVLFDTVVKEIGLSRGGPRYIVGDFNHDLSTLRGWEVLQRAGWKDAQGLAHELWDQDYCMTYRNSSITDHILLSPELVVLVKEVKSWNWFADHLGLGVCIEVPVIKAKQRVWPLPAEIPWESVNYEAWRQADHVIPYEDNLWIDHRVEQWARSYENSFDGYMKTAIGTLPTSCRGRCQRHDPVHREVDCPLIKPSRPGEVQLKTDLVGRAVQRWFQQLRRIQSMVHAKKADKNTPDAVEYRSSLWRAIRKAKGFDGAFEDWWTRRPTQLAGLSNSFPTEPPALDFCNDLL